MMGTSHAASGMVAWLALTSPAPYGFGVVDVGAMEQVAGMVICAGAALLPDTDHPNATIAHSVPGLGSVAAGAAGALSGGHRHGMHSILAVVGCWFLFLWLGGYYIQTGWSFYPEFSLGGAIAGFALTTFAFKVLKVAKTWLRAWLYGLVAGVTLFWFLPTADLWLPLCITVGYAVHLLGDMLTEGGVPLFWPIPVKPPKALHNIPVLNKVWKPNGYFAVPILGTTGSMAETGLLFLMVAYVLLALAMPWAVVAGIF